MSKYLSGPFECEACKKVFHRTIKNPFTEGKKILCRSCCYKNNSLEKYGVDNPSKDKRISSKISSKLTERYEDDTLKEETLEKRRNYCLEHYGAEHHMKNEEAKQRCLDAQTANGGIGWQRKELQEAAEKLAHSESANQKRKTTSLENWGEEHHFRNKEKLATQWDNYKEKTGFDHPSKNPNIDSSNRKYIYNKINFDSSWELAYYIWLIDNKKSFIYHPSTYAEYEDDDGIKRIYQPDFLVEGTFVEIKGDHFFNEYGEPYNVYGKFFWWKKFELLKKYNVKIIRFEETKEYLKYVKEKYGKDYLKTFKRK